MPQDLVFIIAKSGLPRKREAYKMSGKSRYAAVVLAMTASFVLFCAGRFSAHVSSVQPWQVNTARRPPSEGKGGRGMTFNCDNWFSLPRGCRPKRCLCAKSVNLKQFMDVICGLIDQHKVIQNKEAI